MSEFWNVDDDQVMYDYYESHGVKGVQKHLPNRTIDSIRNHACRLGLKFMKARRNDRASQNVKLLELKEKYHFIRWIKADADGRVQVTLNDFFSLHNEIWRRKTGQVVPDSHMVRHKDGDPWNFDFDNLEMVPRLDNLQMPEELRETVRLKRQINRELIKRGK